VDFGNRTFDLNYTENYLSETKLLNQFFRHAAEVQSHLGLQKPFESGLLLLFHNHRYKEPITPHTEMHQQMHHFQSVRYDV